EPHAPGDLRGDEDGCGRERVTQVARAARSRSSALCGAGAARRSPRAARSGPRSGRSILTPGAVSCGCESARPAVPPQRTRPRTPRPRPGRLTGKDGGSYSPASGSSSARNWMRFAGRAGSLASFEGVDTLPRRGADRRAGDRGRGSVVPTASLGSSESGNAIAAGAGAAKSFGSGSTGADGMTVTGPAAPPSLAATGTTPAIAVPEAGASE